MLAITENLADQWPCFEEKFPKNVSFLGIDGQVEKLKIPQTYCEEECGSCMLKAQLFDM